MSIQQKHLVPLVQLKREQELRPQNWSPPNMLLTLFQKMVMHLSGFALVLRDKMTR